MKRSWFTRSTYVLSVAVLLGGQVGSSQDTTDASSSDKKFVHVALQGVNAEMRFGQLAAQKGNSADVKEFGQKIVDDHTKLGDQMKLVAQQEGIDVPDSITGKDKALEVKLRGLSGDAFDRAFIRTMVHDHRKDLSKFQKEAMSGNDTSIRHAASRGAQIIGEHLQIAEQIAQEHGVPSGRDSDND